VKAALSLDGKIATASGESQWITGPKARNFGMKLRQAADAILVGINTVLSDNPKLTIRRGRQVTPRRRFVLDTAGRTPLTAALLTDPYHDLTTIVTSDRAPAERVARLAEFAKVLIAPTKEGRIDLAWLLATLGQDPVASLLVEGGAEVSAAFLLGGFAQRIAFFFAPLIIGGRTAPGAVGGAGIASLAQALKLRELEFRRLGPDLLLTGRVDSPQAASQDVHGNR
jgi:diaminohydroxyphosphoribosylaminopyrimidine deaminase / 5-amino-6-(5-phosphoribosylamino)uracil reductase